MTTLEARRRTTTYHEQYYARHQLYEPGSWLASPDERIDHLSTNLTSRSRVLDLGCGVGRNSIAIADKTGAHVTCVDILPAAIERLAENASRFGVADRIQTAICGMEEFPIAPSGFDLIMIVSAIEHVASRALLERVLRDVKSGTRAGGRVFITTSTGRSIADAATGEPVATSVETPLATDEAAGLFRSLFSDDLEGWSVDELSTTPYRERCNLDGRDVIWQSVEVNLLARKSIG